MLFCAWLAWSRFRVAIAIALRDRTIPTVFAALDTTFRLLGGAPTYVLTDNVWLGCQRDDADPAGRWGPGRATAIPVSPVVVVITPVSLITTRLTAGPARQSQTSRPKPQ